MNKIFGYAKMSKIESKFLIFFYFLSKIASKCFFYHFFIYLFFYFVLGCAASSTSSSDDEELTEMVKKLSGDVVDKVVGELVQKARSETKESSQIVDRNDDEKDDNKRDGDSDMLSAVTSATSSAPAQKSKSNRGGGVLESFGAQQARAANAAKSQKKEKPKCPEGAVELLMDLHKFMLKHPFDQFSWGDQHWRVKRLVEECLDEFIELARYDECLAIGCECIITMASQNYFSCQSARKQAVDNGLWKPLVQLCSSRPVGDLLCSRATRVFMVMSDHLVMHEMRKMHHDQKSISDFWCVRTHLVIFLHSSFNLLVLPKNFEADMYENQCQVISSVLRIISKLILLWGSGHQRVFWNVSVPISFCQALTNKMIEWDLRWGEKVSSHSRGHPLEDMIKVFSVLVVQTTDQIDCMNTLSVRETKSDTSREQIKKTLNDVIPRLHRQAYDLIRAMFSVLQLRIPCYWKKDNHWNMIEERCMDQDSHMAQLIEMLDAIPRISLRKQYLFSPRARGTMLKNKHCSTRSSGWNNACNFLR